MHTCTKFFWNLSDFHPFNKITTILAPFLKVKRFVGLNHLLFFFQTLFLTNLRFINEFFINCLFKIEDMFYEADKVKDGRTAKYIPQLARFAILFLPKCLAISFILNADL